jgi:hypothetical protein
MGSVGMLAEYSVGYQLFGHLFIQPPILGAYKYFIAAKNSPLSSVGNYGNSETLPRYFGLGG